MAHKLVFHSSIPDDLESALDYYDGISSAVTQRFRAAVSRAIAAVRERPEIFPLDVAPIRFAKVDRFDVVAQGLWRKSSDMRQGGGTLLPYSGLEVLSGLVKAGVDIAPGARATVTWLGYRDDGLSTTTPNTGATTSPADRDTSQHTISANFTYNPDNSPWLDLR